MSIFTQHLFKIFITGLSYFSIQKQDRLKIDTTIPIGFTKLREIVTSITHLIKLDKKNLELNLSFFSNPFSNSVNCRISINAKFFIGFNNF